MRLTRVVLPNGLDNPIFDDIKKEAWLEIGRKSLLPLEILRTNVSRETRRIHVILYPRIDISIRGGGEFYPENIGQGGEGGIVGDVLICSSYRFDIGNWLAAFSMLRRQNCPLEI